MILPNQFSGWAVVYGSVATPRYKAVASGMFWVLKRLQNKCKNNGVEFNKLLHRNIHYFEK